MRDFSTRLPFPPWTYYSFVFLYDDAITLYPFPSAVNLLLPLRNRPAISAFIRPCFFLSRTLCNSPKPPLLSRSFLTMAWRVSHPGSRISSCCPSNQSRFPPSLLSSDPWRPHYDRRGEFVPFPLTPKRFFFFFHVFIRINPARNFQPILFCFTAPEMRHPLFPQNSLSIPA